MKIVQVRNKITGLIHDVPADHPAVPPQFRAKPPTAIQNGQLVNDTIWEKDDFHLDYEMVIDEEPKPQPKAK